MVVNGRCSRHDILALPLTKKNLSDEANNAECVRPKRECAERHEHLQLLIVDPQARRMVFLSINTNWWVVGAPLLSKRHLVSFLMWLPDVSRVCVAAALTTDIRPQAAGSECT